MKEYRNLSGKSGISHFQIGEDFINVRFKTGALYVYTLESVESAEILDIMKLVAKNGAGLNGIINAFVYDKYAYRYIENVS